MMPLERDGTLAMIWPAGARPRAAPPTARGYGVGVGMARGAFESVQSSIGFEVTDGAWGALQQSMVPGAVVFAHVERTGEPVAVAVAERRAGGHVEIGWVAVSPVHRGKGLGLSVCAALVRRLVEGGESGLFGSTQDHRLAALRIYFALGFAPVFRAEKTARWRAVCEALGEAFEPGVWGWPPGI